MDETAAVLPDDIVLEVLARVEDVASLFRCALACRRWRGLITDHSFLRRRWPENATHPSFLVGFFTQRRWYPGSEHVAEYPIAQDDVDPDSPLVFIPAPRSVLGHGLRLSPEGLLHGAMPLVARRGLLLVRLAPIVSCGPFHLAVCDLLAGTCDVLPLLEREIPSSFAILTAEDCRSTDEQTPRPAPDYSTLFKVVAIGLAYHVYGGDVEIRLHTFSSAEPGWATPAYRFAFAAAGWRPYVQHDAAVCRRGMAHWLCGDWWSDFHVPSNILTIDTSSEDGRDSLVYLSSLAIEPTSGIFHVTALDGTVTLFCLRTEKEDLPLEIWTWSNHTDLYLTRVIKLKAPEKPLDTVYYLWLGEKSGTLLIMDNLCKYVANLETGEMEELSSQFSGTAGKVVPVEIDWPALFMSRLAENYTDKQL